MTMKLAAIVLVLLSTPVFAESATVPTDAGAPAKSYARDPSGEGDPNAITCRSPQMLPRSRLRGPEVCRTNAQWAQYRKDGMDLAADGIHFQPSEKMRSINPQACHPATMGGSGTSAMAQANFSMVCE
ncbi:MAG TPA: hypothetical protein VGH23_07065 [Rhizomicrobium sp.]|jgi:hypothetical protein